MSRRTFLFPLLLLFVLSACGGDEGETTSSPPTSPPDPRPQPAAVEEIAPTRGLVLVSIDTLRADRLGAYGHEGELSPHLDELAARGVVFERAYVQAPSTLISHMSIFTSLFPPQHGVRPPRQNVLSPEVPTLPEHLLAAGFRTAGHTEGGYMEGDHGFARGFEEWTDPGFSGSTDIESTFEKGLDFLRRVDDDERFFLFLHTYSVHDPYEPPAPYRGSLWEGEPPLDAPASAATLEAINAGRLAADAEEVAYFAARYDEGIRYADQVIGRFVAQLREMAVADDVTLVVTSDHGEEFFEHGKLLHTQVYEELLHVPLIVLHPELPPRRVPTPVRSVDLAPTLLELAAADPLPDAAGRSLLPLLRGAGDGPPRAPIYAEVTFDQRAQTTLLEEVDGRLWQVVESAPTRDPDGAWLGRPFVADVQGARTGVRATSFHRSRTLRVELVTAGEAVPVEPLLDAEIPVGAWREVGLDLPHRGRHRLRFVPESCDAPVELGLSTDPRCLGVMVAQPPLRRLELFDLGVPWDAGAGSPTDDRSFAHPSLLGALRERLRDLEWQRLADPGQRQLGEEERRALEALGYL